MCKSNAAVKEDRVLMWANVVLFFYFLGTIMQRKSNQWSQEHMKHNVSLGPLLHRKKMNGTED